MRPSYKARIAGPIASTTREPTPSLEEWPRLGIRPGNTAVWIGPNDEKITLWGHAARKAQLVSVPVSYRFTPEEMAYVINDSDATLVFCDADYRAIARGARPSKGS